MILWTGVTRLIAANCSVPIFPNQKVSVRLYMVCKKELITTGMAIDMIACTILPLKIRSLLTVFFNKFIILPISYEYL